MMNDGSETIRQLIRLANDDSLDPQSRNAICAMAQQVKQLHNVAQKVSALDSKLKAFNRSANSSES